MENGNWNDVWQIAAELGHYVGDSHQAMHLTLNYNGQLSDNYGIHSRYESEMINPHLDEISFPDSIAGYWESPIDSVFGYIEDIYPLVELVLAADDRAYDTEGSYNNAYYSLMWDDLEDTTIWSLNRAAVDVASIWYTAWVNAGSPYPAGVDIESIQVPDHFQIKAYPNPFNAEITINFTLEQDTRATLKVFDTNGKMVTTLTQGEFTRGAYTFGWNGTSHSGIEVSTGVYLAVLETSEMRIVKKLTLLK